MTFEDAIKDENYQYSRARSWRASGHIESNADYTVSAYGIANDGIVVKMASIQGLDEATKILDRYGKPFPLSPLEKR